jgi:hypothetical protein
MPKGGQGDEVREARVGQEECMPKNELPQGDERSHVSQILVPDFCVLEVQSVELREGSEVGEHIGLEVVRLMDEVLQPHQGRQVTRGGGSERRRFLNV